MDVILHLGAHRTATTTFQYYMADQADRLAASGTEYWGPSYVRTSVFPGLFRNSVAQKRRNVTKRAAGRVKLFTQQAEKRGVQNLLISDENLLGTPISNMRNMRLYPAAGERTARVAHAFGDRVRRIVLSIRSPDLWWASTAALTVERGHPVPNRTRFETISQGRRSWRDVISDMACAAPDAEIVVLPFESAVGRPETILGAALNCKAPIDPEHRWMNRSADLTALRKVLKEQGKDPDQLPDATGRWQPFNDEQAARLWENYADDLHWLIAGADGLAKLTEDTLPKRAPETAPPGDMIKGQGHDQYQLQRQLAQNG